MSDIAHVYNGSYWPPQKQMCIFVYVRDKCVDTKVVFFKKDYNISLKFHIVRVLVIIHSKLTSISHPLSLPFRLVKREIRTRSVYLTLSPDKILIILKDLIHISTPQTKSSSSSPSSTFSRTITSLFINISHTTLQYNT